MLKQILKATLLAGILDISGASVQAYISKGTTPGIILQYIASGVFGKAAYSGGTGYMLFGLLVHFFIVLMCAVIYFLLYPKLGFLQKSIIPGSLLVALVAWTVTTRIVIPLSKIHPAPFKFEKALLAMAILFVCVGLPITFFAKKFYGKKQ